MRNDGSIDIRYLHLGRVTVCGLYVEGELAASGASICHPDDEENEEIGNAIALRRALGKFQHLLTLNIKDLTRAHWRKNGHR